MDAVMERALRDLEALEAGGVDGILVENYMDVPFHPRRVPPVTVAAMTAAVGAVIRDATRPVGVNVLRNDACSAVAVAAATGARFLRVNVHTGSMFTDQGLLSGRAHETLRERRRLGVRAWILADVLVKHAAPPGGVTLERAALDCRERGLADVLVVTGPGTGEAAEPDHVDRVKTVLPGAPVWVGSGLSAESVAQVVPRADGAIVGSAIQRGGVAGREVERERVERFMAAVRRARNQR